MPQEPCTVDQPNLRGAGIGPIVGAAVASRPNSPYFVLSSNPNVTGDLSLRVQGPTSKEIDAILFDGNGDEFCTPGSGVPSYDGTCVNLSPEEKEAWRQAEMTVRLIDKKFGQTIFEEFLQPAERFIIFGDSFESGDTSLWHRTIP